MGCWSKGKLPTESENLSREAAKHVLSEVEGCAKFGKKIFPLRSWRLGAINLVEVILFEHLEGKNLRG
jgi:hypothetical protein